ncbi:flagellar assembly peptidoglycan hydrolase FlgJ [Acidihalobacter prosperus]|uniref:Peptidoglycan hydrolase FlgJ n=1 Tax=Acidihalobacter prosperus TaxID=160660 RepID=A0A1A6C5L3_9GAMM|nr:flagellar assembly peptidoglycan hydrolase FlgJ [Acidihalobacter prosperus]OBS09839.1 flagellar rod assembly protein/muramidase FlgJ [Acidihalobacter prosperus]
MAGALASNVGALASTYTDFQGLAQLKAAAQTNSPGARRAAAKQFEAVFIQMMLKAMREATPQHGLLDNSQTRLYQGLYDHQLAIELAGRDALKLGGLIDHSLGGRPAKPPAAPAVSMPLAPPPNPTAGAGEAARPAAWPPATPGEFVRAVLPYARQAAVSIGVAPEVLVAQAALETGWGKQIPTTPDGRSSFNLFGIKAGGSWQGAQVSVPTMEYRDGALQRERASFRAYPSLAASFADYAHLISTQPRYQEAMTQASNPAAYLDGLQQAGYATDPAYADKIKSILGSQPLLALDPGVKNGANGPLT